MEEPIILTAMDTKAISDTKKVYFYKYDSLKGMPFPDLSIQS